MIDTLKLSRRLQAADMPTAQAEALAEGLAESLREDYVTREHLDARFAEARAHMDTRFAEMNTRFAETRAYVDTRVSGLRTELVMWMFGIVGFATLINHWWR